MAAGTSVRQLLVHFVAVPERQASDPNAHGRLRAGRTSILVGQAVAVALISLASACGHAPTKAGMYDPTAPVYNPMADARSEVAAAMAHARLDHRRVLLVFGANWCGPCRALDRHLHDPAAEAIVEASFHVVDVDIGEGDDQRHGTGYDNVDISRTYGVPLDRGVPAVAVLDGDGHALYTGGVPSTNVNFGGWSPGGGPSADEVMQFLSRWTPH